LDFLFTELGQSSFLCLLGQACYMYWVPSHLQRSALNSYPSRILGVCSCPLYLGVRTVIAIRSPWAIYTRNIVHIYCAFSK